MANDFTFSPIIHSFVFCRLIPCSSLWEWEMGVLVDSTGWLFRLLFPGRIGIWKCWFLWREENRSIREKTLRAGTRTYDAETGNRTQATLVGGECSHHCSIPAPLFVLSRQLNESVVIDSFPQLIICYRYY